MAIAKEMDLPLIGHWPNFVGKVNQVKIARRNQ